MATFLTLFSLWGHSLAAAVAASLALWLGRRYAGTRTARLPVAALSLTAIWALVVAMTGPHAPQAAMLETLRNAIGAWLVTGLPRALCPEDKPREPGFMLVYYLLVATLVAQLVVNLIGAAVPAGWRLHQIVAASATMRMIWAMGILLLLGRIHAALPPDARMRALPVIAALSGLWFFDLVAYAADAVGLPMGAMLLGLRGWLVAVALPVAVLAVRQSGPIEIRPSHALTLGGVRLVLVLLSALAILAAVAFLDALPSAPARMAATIIIFSALVGALSFLPSDRFRALVAVLVAKHLFKHRYDYRSQWMAFADTISRVEAGLTLHQRAIKAMADITGSPAGALLLADEQGRPVLHSEWNWIDDLPADATLDGEVIALLRDRRWVLDVDKLREQAMLGSRENSWLARESTAWALIPVLHFNQLTGIVLLARPRFSRPLDWEDYDMLRTAGRQVASHIAEEQGQTALAEARRFDEFNRRFAFILHDVKNLVSQLALLARNAERHADNPEFRADMVLTLQDCVGKLTDLLNRLSGQRRAVAPRAVHCGLGEIAERTRRARSGQRMLVIEGDSGLAAHADPALVELILTHLVQNAIEASPASAPVTLRLSRLGTDRVLLSIIDQGCGMTPAFLRDDLFRPFASSKPGGFGIGAFEARELARAMGGSLHVESVPGTGSIFTLDLPMAEKGLENREERAA